MPGRYNVAWFEADEARDYHLFCAEYCGTEHSRDDRLGAWCWSPRPTRPGWRGGPAPVSPGGRRREALHRAQLRHLPPRRLGGRGAAARTASSARRSTFRTARPSSPTTAYIRESILNPAARVVAGYQPIMPTYQGQLERGATSCSSSPTSSPCRRRGGGDAGSEASPCPGWCRMSSDGTGRADGRSHGAATLPKEHYLNADYGVRSWLLTIDHKRIALLYLLSITVMFFLGGAYAVLIRLELLDPAGRPRHRRDLQQALHRPRRAHGLLLHDPGHPRGPGELPDPAHDRGPGPGLPADQPALAGTLRHRRRCSPSTPSSPAASTRAGPSTRPTARPSPTPT